MGFLPDNMQSWGACAEFVALDEKYTVKVPPKLTDTEAASLPFVSVIVVQALVG